MKHAVIEDASIELLELFDEVSKEAVLEKRIAPPTNKLSYWWTRKPLIVGRAMILTSTLDNIDNVKLLMGLDNEKNAYLQIPNFDIYQEKLGVDPYTITMLDPFGGSGNLAFPAAQLGINVSISDYNPIAYLLERSMLEYPIKFKHKLEVDFERYAKHVIEKTELEVGKFFKKEHTAYLWCWCITCPHCKQRIPLTNNMWIAKTTTKKIGIKFTPTNDKNFSTELLQNMTNEEGSKFTQKQGKVKCISCGNSIDYKTMTSDIAKNKDREMTVIQIQKSKGFDYILPSEEDKQLYREAVKYFKSKQVEYEKKDLIPKEKIKPNYRKENSLIYYGIKQWNEYFDERQLLVLCVFLKNIREIISHIDDKEYRSVIITYLTFVLAQRVNMSGFGVAWYSGRETPVHIHTFRQPIFASNFSESNPFEKSRSGGFYYILENALKSIAFNKKLKNISKCTLESVTKTSNEKYDLIITDPPYGDDVPYSELSEFFYVWMIRALKDIYPELPSVMPFDEDFCESWGRFGDKKLATQFFEKGLKKSFSSMSDKLKDDGILVVFFAHSSTETWNLFLESIRAAKFKVVSSYSIHTENIGNVIARGKTSFMSSIVVVCRKILKPSEEYFEDIIPKIEDKIKQMIIQIPDEKLLTLPITDLLIMVYGKVLEACTQHTVLKSYQKDFNPDFETLIKDARSFIMKELVGKLTGKSINTIGPEMAFYLLIKIFHRGIIVGDDAIKIAQTYNVDIHQLEKDHIIIKDEKVIRLLHLNEIEMDYSPDSVDKNNLYQQLCYLAYIADSRGSDKLPGIISKDNFRIEDLKQIVSLLIKSYHLRRNKGESLDSKEQKELSILKTLADTMGVKREGILDSFM